MVLQVAVAQDQGGSVFNMLSLKVFRLLSQEERSSDMVWVCLERIVLEVSTWESLLGSRRMNEVAQEPIHSEERGSPRVEHWKDSACPFSWRLLPSIVISHSITLLDCKSPEGNGCI